MPNPVRTVRPKPYVAWIRSRRGNLYTHLANGDCITVFKQDQFYKVCIARGDRRPCFPESRFGTEQEAKQAVEDAFVAAEPRGR